MTAAALSLGLLAAGCSAAVVQPTPQVAAPAPSKSALISSTPQGQVLPISATIDIRGNRIELEVAETPDQRATGFMFRAQIPDNRGMLFPFAPPRPVQFWMRNVQLPLDMVFLRQGEVVAVAADVPPCTATPCPTYGPSEEIDQVIELRGGRAAEIGLQVGDRIDVEFIDPVR